MRIQKKCFQPTALQRPQNPEDYEEEGAPTLRVNPPSSTKSSTLLIIGQYCNLEGQSRPYPIQILVNITVTSPLLKLFLQALFWW